jgi:undecaprenyl-diphosphatase
MNLSQPTSLDVAIVSWLNRFSGRVPKLDAVIGELGRNQTLKGAFLMALVWWLWLRPKGDPVERHQRVVASVAASMVAALVSRVLEHTLPLRPRPMVMPGLHFVPPFMANSEFVIGESSFPSDHASAAVGLCAGLLFASPRLGLAAMAYVLVLVCVPRVYLGYHWPTDILGGIVLGLAFGWLMNLRAARVALARPAQLWLDRSPPTFYAAMFLLTFQIATNFNDVRNLTASFLGLARALAQ